MRVPNDTLIGFSSTRSSTDCQLPFHINVMEPAIMKNVCECSDNKVRCNTLPIEKSKMETSKGTLQYHISGNGKPNIVLINGGSGPIEGWMKVLPEISELSTVFSYNRFGVTGSDKPKEPQDGITIVETLQEALSRVGFEPPFLLVGHSLGGLYIFLVHYALSSHPYRVSSESLRSALMTIRHQRCHPVS